MSTQAASGSRLPWPAAVLLVGLVALLVAFLRPFGGF